MDGRDRGLASFLIALASFGSAGCLTHELWSPDTPGYRDTPIALPLEPREATFELTADGRLHAGRFAFDVPDGFGLPPDLERALEGRSGEVAFENRYAVRAWRLSMPLSSTEIARVPLAFADALHDPEFDIVLIVTRIATDGEREVGVEVLVMDADGVVQRTACSGRLVEPDWPKPSRRELGTLAAVEYREFEAAPVYSDSVVVKSLVTPVVLAADVVIIALGGFLYMFLEDDDDG